MKTLSALIASALLAVQVGWATPFTLTKVSKNSSTGYATAFSVSLLEAGTAGSALLHLQNTSANAARVTRVFIQTPPGAIPGSATGDLTIQLAPVQVLGDFDVQLVDAGASKLLVVKAMKDATGLSLAAAKDLVDHVPAVITSSVGRGDAKLNTIRAVQDATGVSLAEARALVENAPSIIRAGVGRGDSVVPV